MNIRILADVGLLAFVALATVSERCAAAEGDDWLGRDAPLDEGARAALAPAEEWRSAEQYPVRDGAAVTYLFGAGQPDVVCAPLNVCLIELQAGERVVPDGVQLGDAVRWKVVPTIGAGQRTYLTVKPVDVGLETTMAVVTDRRSYHVRLISRRDDYMPIVKWEYPEVANAAWVRYHEERQVEEERATLPNGDKLPDLYFGYSLKGCPRCAWRPVRVYDDGERTVIQMPWQLEQTEAPVLMVETEGERELVNYRVTGDRYIVDQVVSKAVLLAGVGRRQQAVEIERL